MTIFTFTALDTIVLEQNFHTKTSGVAGGHLQIHKGTPA